MHSENLINRRIGDIVAENYNAAGVFKEFGIDFCCGGGISLEKACELKGIGQEEILSKLYPLYEEETHSKNENYSAWEPGHLIDHIEETHHNFVRSKTAEISAYAAKVARVYGERNPETVEIYQKFLALTQDMMNHLKSEEERVFPLILEIYDSRIKGNKVSDEELNVIREELDQMEDEHDHAGGLMKEIRTLSNDFTPPEDACKTYQILYKNQAAFEEDLHKHVHLENNILFKKAEKLLR